MQPRSQTIKDRRMGAILGSAIGDALGKATESISREDLETHFGGRVTKFEKPLPNHPSAHLNAEQFTDDTQQLQVLANSLIEKRGFDVNHFSNGIVEWWKLQKVKKHRRYPGGTSLKAAERLSKGIPPNRSGSKTSESCGSLMRVAPIGAYYSNSHEVAEKARLSSIPTHAHETPVEASAATALIVHFLIKGHEPQEAVKKAIMQLKSLKVKNQLKKALALRFENEQKAQKILGTSRLAHETLGFALYSFLHSPTKPRETLITAANAVPGDTDSIACVAGAFSGAHNGLSKLPKEFVEKIEEKEKLLEIGRRLSSSIF